MQMEKKKLATILGYLGLIPFFTFTIDFEPFRAGKEDD